MLTSLQKCFSFSVCISFSSDITAKSEDNFNQNVSKQTRHFFKVQIKIKFLGRHSGEKQVIFQIFCSSEAKSSRHWRSGERNLNPCGRCPSDALRGLDLPFYIFLVGFHQHQGLYLTEAYRRFSQSQQLLNTHQEQG